MRVENSEADVFVQALQLIPHPEGGFYRESYRAPGTIDQSCLSEHRGSRSYCTAVYYLLRSGEFSALHRLRSDEVWHFYTGASLTLHVIDPVGEYSRIVLGEDAAGGQVFQAVVKAGCWFGATVDDPQSCALVGCTVSPGFDFRDFELGDRQELVSRFPQHRSIIVELTQ